MRGLAQLIRRRLTVPQLMGLGVVMGVFVIGVLTVWQHVSNRVGEAVAPSGGGNVKTVQVLDVNRASFDYLVPGTSDAWSYDLKAAVFDKTSGVVKYAVKMTYAGMNVTISQQAFPDQLKPRGSDKFRNFIDGQNVSRSQDTGRGTVYFITALQNGAPANGADTVIFATDNVLMFGRAERVLGYDAWAKLMGAMRPH